MAISKLSMALVGLMLSTSAMAAQLKVSKARVWAAPEKTRVIFEVSAKPNYKVFTLDNPGRVVVDVSNARATWNRSKVLGGGALRGVRYGKRKRRDLRVVLDIQKGFKAKTYLQKPNKMYGHRLVVELKKAQPKSMPVTHSAKHERGLRDLIIAIDAGHGGEDPGAIGGRGTKEKNVTLRIARQLFYQIEKEPGMSPVMIRGSDYYIPLRKRIVKARAAKADFFVSIHANSFRSSTVKGAAVYVLSRKGASDEAGRWLEKKENGSDEIAGVSLDDKDNVLASILFDLSQSATMEASVGVARNVLKNMGRVGKLHRRRTQAAAFQVLMSPDIPSILVETAFISNPDDERRLRSRTERYRIASSILLGIKKYFTAQPVAGTRYAMWKKKAPQHVVGSGETLSGIAQLYGVSVKQIQLANRGVRNRLSVGKVLTIPR